MSVSVEAAPLRNTALHSAHRRMGARMVPFAGWEMPLEYRGIIAEHLAVRSQAGLFDVSHMGRIDILGADSLSLLQHLTPNDVSRLRPGQAQYSVLLNERAGILDDLLIHKVADHHYFLCVNAARREADYDWLRSHSVGQAQVRDVSDESTQVALQGPHSVDILQPLARIELRALPYYGFADGHVLDVPCRVARTGYTGEDGFELYLPVAESERFWNALLEAGAPHGLLPCGLGARNTLRLEAGMLLYGHDMDEHTTPLEAGLGWICKLDKGPFLGRDVLLQQKQLGPSRRLVGFRMRERAIARDEAPVLHEGRVVGKVTSGSYVPFLKQNVGLAYVPAALARIGQTLYIQIRGNLAAAEVVPTPFYRRPKT